MKYIQPICQMTGRWFALGALLLCGAGLASAQEASTSYRGTSRDPFIKPQPVDLRKPLKKTPSEVAPPSIQARINQYKLQKVQAMNAQQAAPKPTTALLLSEVQTIGIFHTPRGYMAMVEATPIKLSYVVYPGEKFFDGQLVAVEENRLVFRRERRWSDGHRDLIVEMKPLRQTNFVDPLTSAANKVTPASAPDMEGVKDKGNVDNAKEKNVSPPSTANNR